jgi:hypothetical protein
MVPRTRAEGRRSCRRPPYAAWVLGFLRGPYRVGGIYSVVVDDRGFAIARVLATQWRVVHVRVYSNRYRDRPRQIDRGTLFSTPVRAFAQLELNATRPEERPDPGPFAIGHVPLRVASFAAWQPRLIAVAKIEDDELEGYRIWKEHGGGVF